MTVTWDSAFEISPADADEYKYGAGKIRELKLAVRERLEVEHNKDTGVHLVGKVSVVYEGNTANIANLANMSAGALAWDTDLNVWKRYSSNTWVAHDTIPKVTGGGTVDAITCTFVPALTALSNNVLVCVIAAGQNTIVNPTFNPNTLGAGTIVKGANQPLGIGDIPGAGYPILLQYSTTYTAWILLNPAVIVANQANQTDQEAGNDATKYVSPSVQHYHPSSAKVWAIITNANTGTYSLGSNYGMPANANITKNSVGDITLDFSANVFSNVANMVPMTTIGSIEGGRYVKVIDRGANFIRVKVENALGTAVDDSDFICIACFGDL